MPTYTIGTPDGRELDIEAADEATAIRGAQEWAAANPNRKPAQKAAARPVIDPLGDVTGAWNSFIGGLKQDYQQFKADIPRKQKQGILESYGEALVNTPRDLGRTAGHIMEAASIPFAPISGALDRGVAKPYGRVMTKLVPGSTNQEWEDSMNGALTVAAPMKGMRAGAALRRVSPSPPPAAPPPNKFADMVTRFDRAGVTPLPAAAGGRGASAVTNTIAENPIAGAPSRARLRARVAETEASADRLAGQYGDARGAQITGENVQGGVERFANGKPARGALAGAQPARSTSFRAKADALYDEAFSGLDQAMAGKTTPGQSVEVWGAGDTPHQIRTGGSQISTPSTSRVLSDITQGGQSSAIRGLVTDPTVGRAADAIANANRAGDLSFDDLRRLRTWVRTAQKNNDLRQTIGDANLQRMEAALTSDIFANAETLGSPQLAHQLRRADQFYAAGQQRIQTALQPFADAKSGESAYRRLVQAAGSTGSADAKQVLALKRSLAPDEWGDIASNVISELGQQKPGAAPAGQAGFSVSEFVTNYNKLSPRARAILFDSVGGGGKNASELRAALDNLASVADDLKGVEKGANASKTFVNAQSAGTVGGLITAPGPTVAFLSGMSLTGEAMTNPAVARWLAKTARARQAGPRPYEATVRALGTAARANAALIPLHRQALALLEPARPAISAAAQDQQPEGQ